jgi:hypothetical protein
MLFLYTRLVFLAAIGFVFVAILLLVFLSRKAAASNRLIRFSVAHHSQPEDQDNDTNLLSLQQNPAMLN